MPATHTPRRGTNWAEARDFWLSLGPQRSYGEVARRYGVTDTRVRFVAKRDKWQPHADEIDQKALEQAKQRIVRSRADRVVKTLGIVDGLLDRFDTSLDALELRPADLDRVVKLAELLEGEATDRVAAAEAQEWIGTLLTIALKHMPAVSHEAFLAEVRDAVGGLGEAAA